MSHMIDIKLNSVCVCVCCYGPSAVMAHLVLLLAAVEGELGEAGEHSNVSAVNRPNNGQLRQIHINGAAVCHHCQQLSVLTPRKPLNLILLHS